ncbi:N-acetyltransferase [Actinobacillus equuli subsp. haemolyticus]|uniref:GNAT family N-acetyltransferase n=1 Tax=Actinobacillus equuli TaxID=718 RepID=UPI002441CC74|nr:GNAT family N-acetyltransferase [Actinobacillus equuli]WGE53332.1 N-acetyltransferase [Actinobacillus equuli subsp. haemolyticus]WGE63590.1 N-acetyltransferase [Actinobacillus equuli subsp. haemolyticus]WGE66511.1 N-acetyltransferase [Actinobacillus equuli subsp. haemolyticus]WGE69708.1 N-acetyltransferase [Actinobacillus equuli subsp. haemolyticus]WGE73767.1 N-acetyltransferase [Actinobacillus equuli subsp. haemolyticus]
MIKHDLDNFEFSYLTEEGIKAGKLRYRYIKDDVIDVYTTKVDEAFQGKGIAGELYTALIIFAQEKGLKIKPSCSYIEVKMQRSHQDLIA